MAGDEGRRTDGAPPTDIHIEKKKVNWLAWILLALGLLALLLGISRCHREPAATTAAATDNASSGAVVGETADASSSNALSGLGGYLAGTGATPRTFTFEKVNFDTAKSDIRSADQDEVNSVAATLKQYPKSRIRIAGYADTRGSEAANVALGKARADSVKAALVKQGIDAARIETASGGEHDPVDTNATAAGRAENRRTELVVVQR